MPSTMQTNQNKMWMSLKKIILKNLFFFLVPSSPSFLFLTFHFEKDPQEYYKELSRDNHIRHLRDDTHKKLISC